MSSTSRSDCLRIVISAQCHQTKSKGGPAGCRTPRADELPIRVRSGVPIVVCVHKYTDKAQDLLPSIDDASAALFQIQVEHAGQPSITYDIFGSMNKFLRDASAGNADVPTCVSELASAGIRIVLTNGDDPESAGCLVQYRVALYVAGQSEELHNALILLDDFFLWKQGQMAREKQFSVHVHSSFTIGTEGLENCAYTFHTSNTLPLGIFQAHLHTAKSSPPSMLNLTAQTRSRCSLLAACGPFAIVLTTGVNGGYDKRGEGRKYYRSMLVADAIQRQKARDMFSNVLNNLAVRLCVVSAPEPFSPAAHFIDELRTLKCLHPSIYWLEGVHTNRSMAHCGPFVVRADAR